MIKEKAFIHQVTQIVAIQALPVADVPAVHFPSVLKEKLDTEYAVPQDDLFGLVIFLGVARKVNCQSGAHAIDGVQHALEQLVSDVPPNLVKRPSRTSLLSQNP